MANPYPAQVKDENGQIRVDGQVNFTDGSNQPGATFNGGVITTPLVVAPASAAANPLFEVAGADTSLPVVTVVPGGSVTVDAAGPGSTPALQVSQSGTDAAKVVVSANGTVSARGDAGEIALGKTDGSVYFFDVFDGLFGFTQNAVPSDGNFDNNGMCALWLDATPGATRLMIKAKDSGGTFRTAAIALT